MKYGWIVVLVVVFVVYQPSRKLISLLCICYTYIITNENQQERIKLVVAKCNYY